MKVIQNDLLFLDVFINGHPNIEENKNIF